LLEDALTGEADFRALAPSISGEQALALLR